MIMLTLRPSVVAGCSSEYSMLLKLYPLSAASNLIKHSSRGAGRTEIFYLANSINPAELANGHPVGKDDLVIVKADLGKFVRDHVLIKQVVKFQTRKQELLQDLPTNGITPLWAPLLESLTMLLSLQPLSPESHRYITGR
ncbi:hypothetical protein PTTG_29758 [Puccinia triticina 1-1 BBBD Race 1]|uniref:Uncharacterized protein n=1 Tax=Puccinia triticina (isolate 1-1 / race 1 (BBBD)) TaxID=630390 RepID=A0A180G228_PUCT1|nr:hypothetical protein PTTG_29758 [Puccinia triticina 1-1 BBBD Race 1]